MSRMGLVKCLLFLGELIKGIPSLLHCVCVCVGGGLSHLHSRPRGIEAGNELIGFFLSLRYEILTPNSIPKGFMDGKQACVLMVS